MNGSSEFPSEGETPSRIKSSRALALALGFTLDSDSSTGRLKTYTRSFETKGSEGSMILTFDTVYSSKEKPYQHERIDFSVRLGDGSAWIREFPIEFIKAKLADLGIETNQEGAVEKKILKSDGYLSLYAFLERELEEGGRIDGTARGLIAEMIEERAEGREFIENTLIPRMQEELPEFSNTEDKYEEGKEIYFFKDEQEGETTTPVIRFFIRPYQFGHLPFAVLFKRGRRFLGVLIEVGRSRVEAGHVDEDYFYSYGKPYTVAPPSEMQDIEYPRASWTLDEFDQAMEELANYLEKM